jgi:phosphate transport system protein
VPRIHFQQQLAELKDQLLAMAALAQQSVESAVDAYLQRDKGLCQYVKRNEAAINTAQVRTGHIPDILNRGHT